MSQVTRHKLLFNQITIVGLGLIGGSLGMALKKKRIARRVVGIARRRQTLRRALRLGVIDAGSTDHFKGAEGSELIILAAPPESVVPLAASFIRQLDQRAILTDVASTKVEIVRRIEQLLEKGGGPLEFVGGHPMAGSERSGISAARADLFKGAACVLTRTPRTGSKAVSRVRTLWRSVGSRVEVLSPARHDEWVAQVSQVPHMAAVGLVEATSSGALKIAGTGFRGATRIAQASPELWVQISRTNAKEIVRSVDRLVRELKAIRNAITLNRRKVLLKKLRSAQRKRQRLNP
jgi:prephenate dehydrogenase